MEYLEKRQLLANGFEQSGTEENDPSKWYFGIKAIAPIAAIPLGILKALPEITLTLTPTLALYALEYGTPCIKEFSAKHPQVTNLGILSTLIPFLWSVTHEITKVFLPNIKTSDDTEQLANPADWVNGCHLQNLRCITHAFTAFALPTAYWWASHRENPIIPKIPYGFESGAIVAAIAIGGYLSPIVADVLFPYGEKFSNYSSSVVSDENTFLSPCRFYDLRAVASFGFAFALSHSVSRVHETILCKISQVPSIVKAGTLVGVTFLTYPLAHDTINVLTDPEGCTDAHFCNSFLSEVLTMYMNSLDGTVEWLAKNAQPSGKALPILDPVKIYNLSASAASALFTALAGSSYFPDAKAKLSLPHIEMNPVNKGLDKVLEQTAA